MNDEVVRMGQAAEQLLNSEAVDAALISMAERFLNEWRQTNPNDIAGRENCYRMVSCIDLFVAQLQTMADNAKVEINNAEARQKDSVALH